ncbi:MAG TPA: UDP-3-O-(3-hydroxymyristoyl)glucosamine N-acyltransferase [Terracidiphilus sp.]|jgi:UDP-3-O-[3-hydroxymyristoyl] glucosamine N-acyltransferase|nr:UDP-3-O-(3-hydroxymyristoyl)glucosamine N-acyltransferase [Terracidiphilus sp.]
MNLGELIERLGGDLAQGDPEWTVDSVNSWEHAGAFDLAFADSAAAVAMALTGNAGVVVLRPGMVVSYPPTKCVVETDQPRLWFARAAKLLTPRSIAMGVHPRALVAPDALLEVGVTVGAGAVIEAGTHIGENTRIEAGAVISRGVRIGSDCHIHPRAVLYPGVTLGERVIVHAGAVLGADGFGYVRDTRTGAYTQFPQQGTLAIEDDVEIGANTTIDRGALSETRIRRGAKIDNLVHVGHNCDIGEDAILVALTGISGSSSVGNGAVLAGQVGIGDHAHVGPGVILGGQAGVLTGKTVTNEGQKPGSVFWGTPARPLRQVLREQATLARLAKRHGKGPAGSD